MKNSTLNRIIPWLFGPAYIVGILATFLDPNAFYEHVVAEPLRQTVVPALFVRRSASFRTFLALPRDRWFVCFQRRVAVFEGEDQC